MRVLLMLSVASVDISQQNSEGPGAASTSTLPVCASADAQKGVPTSQQF